jgi:cell cycle sensor histidine kinase DivJ
LLPSADAALYSSTKPFAADDNGGIVETLERLRALLRPYAEHQAGQVHTYAAESAVPAEVEALLEQVNLAYEQQTRLIRGIGHDFKSPLASILRSSEALAAGEFGPIAPDQAEVCRLIAESARHLTGIAQALYAMGDARDDAPRFEHVEVDAREPLERAVNAHRSAAAAKEIELELALPERPLPVCAARGALERIFGNLLNNAVKFTYEGGISVTCRHRDGALQVVVADTGIGIPADELASIGTEFVRGSNAVEQSGAGVGLAVVQHLLDGMGGTLTIASELGRGSSFTIDIPLAHAMCGDGE